VSRGIRKIEIEFGVRISDVNPTELSGLLEQLAALASNTRVQLDASTQQLLKEHGKLPLALETASRTREPWGILQPELEQALRECGGNVRATAKKLKCSAAHIYALRKRYGLIPKETV